MNGKRQRKHVAAQFELPGVTNVFNLFGEKMPELPERKPMQRATGERQTVMGICEGCGTTAQLEALSLCAACLNKDLPI